MCWRSSNQQNVLQRKESTKISLVKLNKKRIKKDDLKGSRKLNKVMNQPQVIRSSRRVDAFAFLLPFVFLFVTVLGEPFWKEERRGSSAP